MDHMPRFGYRGLPYELYEGEGGRVACVIDPDCTTQLRPSCLELERVGMAYEIVAEHPTYDLRRIAPLHRHCLDVPGFGEPAPFYQLKDVLDCADIVTLYLRGRVGAKARGKSIRF